MNRVKMKKLNFKKKNSIINMTNMESEKTETYEDTETVPSIETDGYNSKLYAKERQKEESKNKLGELRVELKKIQDELEALKEKKLTDLRVICKANKLKSSGNKSELQLRIKNLYIDRECELEEEIKPLEKAEKKADKGVIDKRRVKWMKINLGSTRFNLDREKKSKEDKNPKKMSKAEREKNLKLSIERLNEVKKLIYNRYVEDVPEIQDDERQGKKSMSTAEIRQRLSQIYISVEIFNDQHEVNRHFHIYLSHNTHLPGYFYVQEKSYWNKQIYEIDEKTGNRVDGKGNNFEFGRDSDKQWREYICKDFTYLTPEYEVDGTIASVEGYQKTPKGIVKIDDSVFKGEQKAYEDRNGRTTVRAYLGLRNTPALQEENDIKGLLVKIMNKNGVKVVFETRQLVQFYDTPKRYGYHEIEMKEFYSMRDRYIQEAAELQTGKKSDTVLEDIVSLKGQDIMKKLINQHWSRSLPVYEPDERYIGFKNCRFNVVTGLPEPYKDDGIECKYYSRYNYRHDIEPPIEYLRLFIRQQNRDALNKNILKDFFGHLRQYTQPIDDDNTDWYPGTQFFGAPRTGKDSAYLPYHEVDKFRIKKIEIKPGTSFSFENVFPYRHIYTSETNLLIQSGATGAVIKQTTDGDITPIDCKGGLNRLMKPLVFSATTNDTYYPPAYTIDGNCADNHYHAIHERLKGGIYQFHRDPTDQPISREEQQKFKFLLEQASAHIMAFACINPNTYKKELKYTDEELKITDEPIVYLKRDEVFPPRKQFDYVFNI